MLQVFLSLHLDDFLNKEIPLLGMCRCNQGQALPVDPIQEIIHITTSAREFKRNSREQ